MSAAWRLSREQRARLLAGDYRPLTFSARPACGRGSVYVLSRSRQTRTADRDGHVTVLPSEPTLWLEVTALTKTTAGWTVRFRVHDRRDSELFLHRDSTHGYTRDPRLALRGEPPALADAATRERYAAEARERDKLRKAQEAARREAELALWQRLKRLEEDAARGLDVRRQLAQIRSRVEAAERKRARRAA